MAVLHFPFYLCSITKYLDGNPPHVRRSRQHNLMERNTGVKIKSAFSATYCSTAVHTNPAGLVQFV